MTINGSTIKRPTKQALASGIANHLGLDAPNVSRGSSVASGFLSEVHQALGGGSLADMDAYRKTERVLQALGLPYDPWWDTSEAAPTGGGSTVTTRAYSRILAAIAHTPRCFIINTTDHPVSAKYDDQHESSYNYDDQVTGRVALNDAGPGSRVVFYTTRNASQDKMSFTAHARIDYIASGWEGPSWRAALSDYESFDHAVPRANVDIDGWNIQHSIVEITWDTYAAIVTAGGINLLDPTEAPAHDATSTRLAERVRNAYPPPPDSLFFAGRADPIPDTLPTGTLQEHEPLSPDYKETATGELEVPGVQIPPTRRTPEQRRLDRIAEQRAVQIATQYLIAEGWTLAGDHQTAGIGFDLTFTKDGRALHVEVKGIQGPRLTFNLTPKEWWRARTDDHFAVLAVTSVLSPEDYHVHVLTREQLLVAPRRVTGYRLDLATSE